ncbi:TauD/TfdA family dioxygenase [Halomonas sp. QX-2]|jgi:taurine dioxygenase|uniref:TauD/TfdA family dioxygenase n=1 Tax=Vreelandella sedimenti TaxID=2729618 RepID=A0A7Z0SME0_9GAMM|nr:MULTISPECIES: TauD/TfdA family dioxygenase [Halomonas]NYT71901.1 TauD/TfdA family dioxygenase [Halomonas sedimenti]|tara:strand:+ start:133681 stop:134538 length:858 start_codon:yes stop_codon:yes gene_type:complete
MTLNTTPLTATFGIEVHDLDLSQPQPDGVIDELQSALNHYSVIVLRDQRLESARHVELSRQFGPLMVHVLKQFLATGHPEIYVLSNVSENGQPIGNHKEGWNWHSDLSYVEEPSMGSLLHAIEVPPEGGDTLFASMHAAYDALSYATQQRIKQLSAVHSYVGYYAKAFADRTPLSDEQRAKTPDVIHPLVRAHPRTGRPSLYVGQDIIKEIVGLPPQESQQLLDELNQHAIRDEFVYRHRWQAGDLVIWDNRCTMHCATPYDDNRYRRVMHRTTVKGDRPFASCE